MRYHVSFVALTLWSGADDEGATTTQICLRRRRFARHTIIFYLLSILQLQERRSFAALGAKKQREDWCWPSFRTWLSELFFACFLYYQRRLLLKDDRFFSMGVYIHVFFYRFKNVLAVSNARFVTSSADTSAEYWTQSRPGTSGFVCCTIALHSRLLFFIISPAWKDVILQYPFARDN